MSDQRLLLTATALQSAILGIAIPGRGLNTRKAPAINPYCNHQPCITKIFTHQTNGENLTPETLFTGNVKFSRSTIYMPWQVGHTCACWCKRVRGCGYKRRLWAGSRCVCGRAGVSLMGENTVKGKMDTSIVQLYTTGHMHTLPVTC